MILRSTASAERNAWSSERRFWTVKVTFLGGYTLLHSANHCVDKTICVKLSQYCMEDFASASNRDSLGRLHRKLLATPTECSYSSNWIFTHRLYWVSVPLSNKALISRLCYTSSTENLPEFVIHTAWCAPCLVLTKFICSKALQPISKQ